MADWIDNYIDNEGYDANNRAFTFTSRKIECGVFDNLSALLKDVIRQCSKVEKELNYENFKKLRITIVNEYCFNAISRLEKKKDSKYEYIILLPKDIILERNQELIKHKFAHEIAHFLFSLQRKKFNNQVEEERECYERTDEWGFPDPEMEE